MAGWLGHSSHSRVLQQPFCLMGPRASSLGTTLDRRKLRRLDDKNRIDSMFRFTIRDVLWLMVVVSMGVGWYVHLRAEKRRMARQIEVMNAELSRGMETQRRVTEKLEQLRAFTIERWPEAAQ